MDGKRRFFSVLLALTMAFNSVCYATTVNAPSMFDSTNHYKNAEEFTIDTEVTVASPTLTLSWPTSMPFAIDPFNIQNEGQVYSADSLIMNYTPCPVRLDAQVYVKANDEDFNSISDINYVLCSSPSDVNKSDATNTENEIYMEVACPYRSALNIINENTTEIKYPVPDGASVNDTFNYQGRTVDAYNYGYNIPILSKRENKPTRLSFVIGPPKFENNQPVQTEESIAAFKYVGEINTFANWAKVSDKGSNIGTEKPIIKVLTVFSAKPITAGQRKQIERDYLPHSAYGTIAGLFVEDGVRPSIVDGDVYAALGDAEGAVMTVDLGSGINKAEGIQSIVIKGLPSTTSITSTATTDKELKVGTDYEFNAETNEITLKVANNTWYVSRAEKLGGNTYTVLVTFNDYDETTAEGQLTFTTDSEPPRFEGATSKVTLASGVGATDGTNARYSIYMGKGLEKATGIQSFVIKDMPANETEGDTTTADRTVGSGTGGYKLSVDGTAGEIELDISSSQWYINRIRKITGNSYPVIITLNDKNKTVIRTTVEFLSDAESPSFVKANKAEVLLASGVGAGDGTDAEYSIKLGSGALAATGVKSIVIKDMPSSALESTTTTADRTLTTSEYTFDKDTGLIKFNISDVEWYLDRVTKLKNNTYDVIIKLNDMNNTELTTNVTFKANVEAPSFGGANNAEVLLASKAGATDGTNAEYKVNLGSGVLGATRIESITIKNMPSSATAGNDTKADRVLTTSEYAYDKVTGLLTLNISNIQWYLDRDVKLKNNTYDVVIKLNDKNKSEFTTNVTFKAAAESPSFEAVNNSEVLLASKAGATDGVNAEYKVNLGSGTLAATGIESIIIKNMPSTTTVSDTTKADRTLPTTEYAIDKTTGVITLKVSNIQWYLDRDLKLRDNTYDVVIKMNDKNKTEITTNITFKSGAVSPSLEETINSEVLLASKAGVADGVNAEYKVNLGTGALAATGIESVVIKNMPSTATAGDTTTADKTLSTTEYAIDKTTGIVTLKISNVQWYLERDLKIRDKEYDVVIKLNDKNKTELTTNVTFKSGAVSPSFEAINNEEVLLASGAGAGDGTNAEYKINLGTGTLAATGIASIVIKNMPANAVEGDNTVTDRTLSTTEYTLDKATGILMLKISDIQWYLSRDLKLRNNKYDVVIKLNDTNKTEFTTSVAFNSTAEVPSFGSIINKEEILASDVGGKGTEAQYSINLGKGSLAATRVSSVVIKDMPDDSGTGVADKVLSFGTGYTFDANKGELTLNISGTEWYLMNSLKLNNNTYKVVITMNDSANTEFETEITFKSDAKLPLLEEVINKDVTLASRAGATDGINAQYKIDMGIGALRATGISKVVIKDMPATATAGDNSTSDRVVVAGVGGYSYNSDDSTLSLDISNVAWYINRASKISKNTYDIEITLNDINSTVIRSEVMFISEDEEPSFTPINPNITLSSTTSSKDGSNATFTLNLGRGKNSASAIRSLIIQKVPSMTSMTSTITTNRTIVEGVSGYSYDPDTKLLTLNLSNVEWYINRTHRLVGNSYNMAITLDNDMVFNCPITFNSAAKEPAFTVDTTNIKLASVADGKDGVNGTLTISLGTGSLAATGVSKVVIKDMPANTTAGDTSTADRLLTAGSTGYSFNTAKGTLTLPISGVAWYFNRKSKIVGKSYKIQVQMNNKKSTVIEGTVSFS